MPGSPPADGDSERSEPDVLAALRPELALSRLPVGRHGLPRSFVERIQRLRLIGAMLRVLPRCGYPQTTIGDLIREAGVSRSAFYAQFESKEACFLAAYDLAAEWLCERVAGAAAEEGRWTSRVSAGISEALRLLGANPELARLVSVEALQAGPAARHRRQDCIAGLAAALKEGRPNQANLPPYLEELLIGGVLAHVGRYVDTDCIEQLPEAGPELLQFMLAPYLGPEKSRCIVDRAA